RSQPLRLLFQVVAALADQVADVALRLPGLLLRLLQELAATLDEVLARLLAAPGREEQSHGCASQTAEQEPSQISRRVTSTLSWHRSPSQAASSRNACPSTASQKRRSPS